MNRQQALEWVMDNAPAWPKSVLTFWIPNEMQWDFYRDSNFKVVFWNLNDGDAPITKAEWLAAKEQKK